LILALKPEAAGEPGFQMSFAATAALVALAEAWPRPVREISTPWPIRWCRAGAGWRSASAPASWRAWRPGRSPCSTSTASAVWGLPANLAVAPLSSFVIMPFLALGALLEPFGLGAPFLAVAGWGIDGDGRGSPAASPAPIGGQL
jgi:competence protein ComEC